MNDNLQNQVLPDKALEAEANYIVGLLDSHAQNLSMRQLKQLEDARNNAVHAHANRGRSVNRDGSLTLTNWVSDHRLAMLGMLLAGILMAVLAMQLLNRNQEPSDAFLLSADLPPEAFVDRGFEPWLNAKLAVNTQQIDKLN